MASPIMISHSDSGGGADRAAFRILQSVALHEPLVEMWVADSTTGDSHVHTFDQILGSEPRWRGQLRPLSESIPLYLQKSSNSVHRSFNVIPRGIVPAIEHRQPIATHLHWLGQGTLALKEIGLLPGPVVWTLHDSWPFCGAEHHPEDDRDHRFQEAYSRVSRRPGNSRIDVDAWTYRRKARWFTQPRWLVGPSQWMVDQARRSTLTANWPASVIPNPIDSEVFHPVPKAEARERWGMNQSHRIALFGGMAADNVHGKGWDLLQEAITALPRNDTPWELWTFGGRQQTTSLDGIQVRSVGVVDDPLALAALYSAADVHVVPSRMESFSQTAAESIACGTPVVAFRVGGVPEVVRNSQVGVLVDAFHTRAFAAAMNDAVGLKQVCSHAGPDLARAWRPATVGEQYLETYFLAREEWERRIRSRPQS